MFFHEICKIGSLNFSKISNKVAISQLKNMALRSSRKKVPEIIKKGGDSYRIQTCNLLIRSQMLYSVELRSRIEGTLNQR